MRMALVLLIVAFGLFSMAFTRFAGLLLYVWFALFRTQEWVWGTLDSLRLSLIVGAAFVGSCLMTGVYPNVKHPLSVGALLFVAISLVAQANAVDQATGWLWIDSLFRMVLVSLLMVTLVTTPKRLIAVIAVAAGSLGFHTAKYGVGFLIRGGARFTVGIGGMFGDNNDFALAAARIVFFLIAAAQNLQFIPARLGFAAAIPLTLLCIVSTFSRGGFLALAVATFVFVLLQRQRFWALTGMGIVGIVMLLTVPLPTDYFDRLRSVASYQEGQDNSALGRLHYWQVAVQMARENPFGVGLKNYQARYDQYDSSNGRFGTSRSVHSTYFQVLAETGFLGLFVFLALLGYSFKAALRVRARSKDPRLEPEIARTLFTTSNAMIASMTAFVIGGAFLGQALNDLNWFTLGIVSAMDIMSARLCAQEGEAPQKAPRTPAQLPHFAASPAGRRVRVR
jgi:putative inorganic carbon (hco3(-)) transporter